MIVAQQSVAVPLVGKESVVLHLSEPVVGGGGIDAGGALLAEVVGAGEAEAVVVDLVVASKAGVGGDADVERVGIAAPEVKVRQERSGPGLLRIDAFDVGDGDGLAAGLDLGRAADGLCRRGILGGD